MMMSALIDIIEIYYGNSCGYAVINSSRKLPMIISIDLYRRTAHQRSL